MDDWGNQLQHEAINVRFEKGIKRMQAIETELHAAREELHQLCQLREDMAEMLDFFKAMQGAFKVLNWVGALAKPLAGLVALGVALATAWAAARGGR